MAPNIQPAVSVGASVFLFWCAVAAILSPWIAPAEDAAILYIYSENLWDHGLIAYNEVGPPAEGATDFLWMCLISVGYGLGASSFGVSLVLSALGVGWIAGILRYLSKSGGQWWVALVASPFMVAAMYGFSPLFFAGTYALLLLAWRRGTPAQVGLAALLLCLVRPDGAVWGAPVVLASLWGSDDKGKAVQRLLWTLVVPGLVYFFWRWNYFGELLPLPFYVKSAFDRFLGIFHFDSLRGNIIWLVILSPLLGASAWTWFRQKRWGELGWALLIFGVPWVFYSVMMLSQNVAYRFQAPFLVLCLLLAATAGIAPRLRALSMVGTIGLMLYYTPAFWQDALHSQQDVVASVAKSMAKLPAGVLMSTESGKLPYYSGWRAIDPWGLNTPVYARGLIQPGDVINEHPDVLMMHAEDNDYGFFGEAGLKAGTERLWRQQTINLYLGVSQMDYQLWWLDYRDCGVKTPLEQPALVWQGVQKRAELEYGFESPRVGLRCVQPNDSDLLAVFVSRDYPAFDQMGALLKSWGAQPGEHLDGGRGFNPPRQEDALLR